MDRDGSFSLADVLDTGPCRQPSEVMGSVAEVIRRFDPRPSAVGVGIAGLVDPGRGFLSFSPNLPLWNGTHVSALLSRLLGGVPVFVDNDCNAFAIGGLHRGIIPDAGLWLFITLGTGIGGTIISDGRLIYGTGTAGEFGHMTIREGGRMCTCGLRGCWERYAAREALMSYYDGRTEPRMIARKARKGDEKALAAFSEYGKWLGKGMSNLAKCLAPDGFFLGGGLSGCHPLYQRHARREFESRCPNGWNVRVLDDTSTAGAFGAAAMASGRC
jgi:glucokinase